MEEKERLLASMPQLLLPLGWQIPAEDDYVSGVDAYAHFDLDLARDSMQFWSREQDDPEELLRQVTCPTLIMQQDSGFAKPNATVAVRDLPSDQPNVRRVVLENAGHLMHTAALDTFIAQVREFLVQAGQ